MRYSTRLFKGIMFIGDKCTNVRSFRTIRGLVQIPSDHTSKDPRYIPKLVKFSECFRRQIFHVKITNPLNYLY